jgi:hypothetical protein
LLISFESLPIQILKTAGAIARLMTPLGIYPLAMCLFVLFTSGSRQGGLVSFLLVSQLDIFNLAAKYSKSTYCLTSPSIEAANIEHGRPDIDSAIFSSHTDPNKYHQKAKKDQILIKM